MNGMNTAKNHAESAIAFTESVTGLRVTVHDLTHTLWQHLSVDRFRHTHSLCSLVKTGPYGERCIELEVDSVRRDANRFPDGRVHRCHAGLTEVCVPVFDQDRLVLVLFLGPFRLAADARAHWSQPASRTADASATGSLAALSRTELDLALEALRQLGARLRGIIAEQNLDLSAPDLDRTLRIRRFVAANFHRAVTVADLATELGLSPDRARHVVREACGESFRRLLEQTRMSAAAALLLNSRLPVSEVAERCGYTDSAAFGRSFARVHGASPSAWRAGARP
ncbi:MAG: helix-turn-helix domain-containing protein [Spirochaetaceae bacterium]|nr:MAG: helix-turn-helix domain-containing protein [Spirochaetaceae bacterium]